MREGAPRVTSRTHPNPSTRPFIPLALFSFFDGVISLPHCSQLIAQHLANSSSHVRTAAQEFTRAEGTLKFSYTRLTTEIVDCCRIYQFPQPSHGGPPPLTGPLPAQGPSGSMPAPALNVRPRPPAESRSRTLPGPLGPSLFDYDADTLKQGVIAGSSGRKALPPGGLPTRRSCNSQFFFPTSCLWRTGMQGSMAYQQLPECENHVRELRTFFTVVLEPNIHTFSVLSETLPDFLKSKLC